MAMPVFVQSNAEAQRRWLITFSDLISLLLAFFVMLEEATSRCLRSIGGHGTR